MRRFTFVAVSTLFMQIAPPVLADAGCAPDSRKEHIEYAKKLIALFPSINEEVARLGGFTAKSDNNTGKVSISYMNQGKTIFSTIAPTTDPKSNLSYCAVHASPINSKALSGLGVSFGCGSGVVSAGCQIRVLPVMGRDGKAGWGISVVDDPGEKKGVPIVPRSK